MVQVLFELTAAERIAVLGPYQIVYRCLLSAYVAQSLRSTVEIPFRILLARAALLQLRLFAEKVLRHPPVFGDLPPCQRRTLRSVGKQCARPLASRCFQDVYRQFLNGSSPMKTLSASVAKPFLTCTRRTASELFIRRNISILRFSRRRNPSANDISSYDKSAT